jgi:hypothetical protein
MPLSSAILPAFRGSPASIIVANTFALVSIVLIVLIVIISYCECDFAIRLATFDILLIDDFCIASLEHSTLST